MQMGNASCDCLVEDRFYTGESIVHVIDSRIKILVVVLFSVIMAVSNKTSILLSGLLLSFLLVMFSKLNIRKLLRRIFIVNGFILFLWLTLPFFSPGKVAFSFGLFKVSVEGIKTAFFITIKSNAIILMSIALLSTSPMFNIIHALYRMHIPDKLVCLFFFSYRYIYVMYDECTRLMRSMSVRNFRNKTSMYSYKTYAKLVGMLFLRSYERSERIYNAMISRGFEGKFAGMDNFSIKGADIAFSIILSLYFISLLIFSIA